MYQDDEFCVTEAVDLVVRRLFGFTNEQCDTMPEKVVLIGDDNRRFAFYLSAFIGHWDGVDDEAYDEMLADYEDSRQVDYATIHGLVGARVLEARCLEGSAGTQIVLVLDRGTLTLAPVDDHDPHSASRLSFSRPHQRRGFESS